MGNNSPKNDNFGQNYNINEHNRKMAQINHNYQNHNLHIPNGPRKYKQVKQQKSQNIIRKNAIFKPSISIKFTSNSFQIIFEYFSQQGCKLLIYVGVNNIIQNIVTQKTQSIESDFKFINQLKPAKRQKAVLNFQINNSKQFLKKQLILRIQTESQASQYELRKGNQKQQQWKIILQKLEFGNQTYEIQNIYKGGQQEQQCIICMTDIANTIVKPCNHMCLCKQCAGILNKSATDKCPICRVHFTDLITINNSTVTNEKLV